MAIITLSIAYAKGGFNLHKHQRKERFFDVYRHIVNYLTKFIVGNPHVISYKKAPPFSGA
ncbi:MAG: hypothetical protein IJH40_04470 [Ruminococcus sp.]|uniref:hypothetical protein n=1 Tax=Ruminococcus sp. TaxID=41978 RepID=UPI002872CA1C|nr:hypothetical protein [Ruminococcus sp.]MBQ3284879.1 hypothetical protein [Ruminococcus sp.]